MSLEEPHNRISNLEKENEKLRNKVQSLEKKQKDRRRSKRYLFGKKAAFIIMGKGLKDSLYQMYEELPNVSRDTFSDVSAHIIWRITRVGLFTLLISITPLLILVGQT